MSIFKLVVVGALMVKVELRIFALVGCVVILAATLNCIYNF